MKVIVQKKPDQFEAERFLVNEIPWPDGVKQVGKNKYRFVVNVALSWKIEDTDWIVHLPGKTSIFSDKEFHKYYSIC